MPQNRYFYEKDLKKDEIITLDKKEFFHLKKVMRKNVNDMLEVINGKNILAIGKIIEISKDSAKIKLIEINEAKKNNNNKSVLAVPFLKQAKLDLIIEKATELNVSKIILYKADHSDIKNLSENKINRMQNIIISALKQSGRLDFLEIEIINSIKDLKKFSYDFYFGTISKNSKKISILKDPICVCIGPESGFSEKEILFLKNDLKAKPISINKNILRAETAAIAFGSIINYLLLK